MESVFEFLRRMVAQPTFTPYGSNFLGHPDLVCISECTSCGVFPNICAVFLQPCRSLENLFESIIMTFIRDYWDRH